MNQNDTVWKILNLFWIPITFIPFFNGLGFIYAGWRVNETKWIDEGIIYMIPFIFLSFTIFNDIVLYMAILSLIVGIIRAYMIVKPFLEKLKEKNDKNTHSDNHTTSNISQNKAPTSTKNSNENKKIVDISIEDLRKTSISKEKIDKLIAYKNSGYIFTSINDLSEKISLNESDIQEIEKLIEKKEKISNSRILDI
ncbi:MAG TPA: hypothetical protein HA255_00740 [Methanosphaera sp.]|nr:hypothetical protein [Methanosphaera sp.]